MLLADQHRGLAEIFEEAAADESHAPADRALLAEKAARFRALARVAEQGEGSSAELKARCRRGHCKRTGSLHRKQLAGGLAVRERRIRLKLSMNRGSAIRSQRTI